MVRHNNVVPNQHFKKKWQFYVKTWFNQPARKHRRRDGALHTFAPWSGSAKGSATALSFAYMPHDALVEWCCRFNAACYPLEPGRLLVLWFAGLSSMQPLLKLDVGTVAKNRTLGATHSLIWFVFKRLDWYWKCSNPSLVAGLALLHRIPSETLKGFVGCPARKKKAAAIYPRPQAGPLRPIVHGQTVKYNLKKRLGRGFTLEELKASP
jgi:ribosomal protein L13E